MIVKNDDGLEEMKKRKNAARARRRRAKRVERVEILKREIEALNNEQRMNLGILDHSTSSLERAYEIIKSIGGFAMTKRHHFNLLEKGLEAGLPEEDIRERSTTYIRHSGLAGITRLNTFNLLLDEILSWLFPSITTYFIALLESQSEAQAKRPNMIRDAILKIGKELGLPPFPKDLLVEIEPEVTTIIDDLRTLTQDLLKCRDEVIDHIDSNRSILQAVTMNYSFQNLARLQVIMHGSNRYQKTIRQIIDIDPLVGDHSQCVINLKSNALCECLAMEQFPEVDNLYKEMNEDLAIAKSVLKDSADFRELMRLSMKEDLNQIELDKKTKFLSSYKSGNHHKL
eukprot:TRINITY_DN7648_c0_g1_i2.p1 TRINITY_DN7648_c0_g1~~TRINITY_DN7648_c0_g1_i2.p1  ORF type:complete len:342 (+),score=37.32 TRINITY_DN7648_c0_g1_i2:501-1526(+)